MLQRYSPIHWWKRPPSPSLFDLRCEKAGKLVDFYGSRIGAPHDITHTAARMARSLVQEGHSVHRAYSKATSLLDQQADATGGWKRTRT